jgi:pimeloyl-ACP methyl ester carboxylesterase
MTQHQASIEGTTDHAVGGAIATVGSLALWQFLIGRRVKPLASPLGGEALDFEWRGHRVAYTKLGAGSPVILVHGIHAAGWSYEWRRVADGLARNHTVYAIDLLGFGRSARPNLRYTAALYLSLVDDFARRVVRRPAALVATSLAAAYAIALGARDPERFPALVLVGPTGLTRLNTPLKGTSVARGIVQTPLVGTALWNALVSRPSMRRFLRMSYADKTRVDAELLEAYWQAAHQRGAKHAPASFVGHLLDLDVREPFHRLTQPTFVLWGEQAAAAPVEEIRPFMSSRPDVEYVILDPAGDLVHDERPNDFVRLVSEFLARAGHVGTPSEVPSAPGAPGEPRRVA